jgi:hypothetical protein
MVCDALFAQRNDELRPCEPLSERAMATDGRSGGAEWYASVRADHRFSIRHDSKGLAAGKQRAGPGVLGARLLMPQISFPFRCFCV